MKDPQQKHHEFPTTHGKIKKKNGPPKKPGDVTIQKPLNMVGFGVQKRATSARQGSLLEPSAFLRCQAVDPMTGASMTRTYGLMTPFDTKMQDPVVADDTLILTGSDCVFMGFFFVKVN